MSDAIIEASAINIKVEQVVATAEQRSRKRAKEILIGREGPSNSNNSGGSKQGRRSPKPPSGIVEARSSGRAQGLRGFAMSVCNKIEAKGKTTYNEVADELVEELRDDPESGGEYFEQLQLHRHACLIMWPNAMYYECLLSCVQCMQVMIKTSADGSMMH